MDAITIILGIVSVLLIFIVLAYLFYVGTSANVNSEWIYDRENTMSELPEGMLTDVNMDSVDALFSNQFQPLRIKTKQDPNREQFIFMETSMEGSVINNNELYVLDSSGGQMITKYVGSSTNDRIIIKGSNLIFTEYKAVGALFDKNYTYNLIFKRA